MSSSVTYPSSNNNNGCELLGVAGDPSAMTNPVIGLVSGVKTWIEAPSGGLDFQKVIDSYPKIDVNGTPMMRIYFKCELTIKVFNGLTIGDLAPTNSNYFDRFSGLSASVLNGTTAVIDGSGAVSEMFWPMTGDIDCEVQVTIESKGIFAMGTTPSLASFSSPASYYGGMKLIPVRNFTFGTRGAAYLYKDNQGASQGLLDYMWVKGELNFIGLANTPTIAPSPNLTQDSTLGSTAFPSWYAIAAS